MDGLVLIPAAGRGSRLGSHLPKALVPVNGLTMLEHLFRLYDDVADRFIVVVAPSAEDIVRSTCSDLPYAVELAVQHEPTGMLDAILQPHARVAALRPRRVWITWCDQVAVHPDTVARLAHDASADDAPALTMPVVRRDQPYIHLDRDEHGAIRRILQRREGDEMPVVGESDMGLFNLSGDAYLDLLPRFGTEAQPAPGTGERNFLPFIPWLQRRATVSTVAATHALESVGINTPEELERVAAYLRDPDALTGVGS